MRADGLKVLSENPLALALAAVALFMGGAVLTWLQEYLPWLSHRVSSLLALAGLAMSVWALVGCARRIFRLEPLVRAEVRQVTAAIVVAALPPALFLIWLAWASTLAGK